MANLSSIKTQKRTSEAMVKIPLSALRYLSKHPSKGKIVVEISVDELKRLNKAGTLDEIINEARLDYALGNYKTFTSSQDLIDELHS